MESRTMPVATFRCDVCSKQSSQQLTRYTRRVNENDRCTPQPRHHRRPMRLIQVDQLQGGE